MRNTPVALWAADESLESLVDLAGRQASLTHHDPHNAYGAAIHAAMIRAGIHGEDVFAAVEKALDVLPAEAREQWMPLLAPRWQPDTNKNNGTVWDCLAEAVWAVRTAATFEEAIVNAIVHGNKLDPGKSVRVACLVTPNLARIEVADEGAGFDPSALPDCRLEDRLEAPNGRGVMLMRNFMTRVEYNARGNRVIMEKEQPPPEG